MKEIDFQMKTILQFLKLKKLLFKLLYIFFPYVSMFLLYNHIAICENWLPPRWYGRETIAGLQKKGEREICMLKIS